MTIEIPLTQGYTTIIDDVDKDLAAFKWSYHKSNTAQRGVNRKIVFIYRTVLERMLGRPLTSKEQCDHINLNRLDNRRSNLRLATPSQNMRNNNRQSGRCGLKGVSWHNQNKRWQARIRVNKRNLHVGIFATPLEAHCAYCIAALTYHKEFANFGSNSPYAGWTLADFELPVKQLSLPLPIAA